MMMKRGTSRTTTLLATLLATLALVDARSTGPSSCTATGGHGAANAANVGYTLTTTAGRRVGTVHFTFGRYFAAKDN
jgi:hypothetical protein